MCGLTALIIKDFSIKSSLTNLSSFKKLTVLAAERGRDTSGVYLVLRSNSDNNVFSFSIKSDGTAEYIFQSNQYMEIVEKIRAGNLSLLLAVSHTRMATVGDTEDPVQNQPLISDDQVLFFNGIVTNKISNKNSLYRPDHINDGWEYIKIPFINIDEQFGIANLLRFNERTGVLEAYTNNGDLFKVDLNNRCTFISSDDRFIKKVFPNVLSVAIPKNVTNFFNLKPVDISQHKKIKTGLKPVKSQMSYSISAATISNLTQLMKIKINNIKRCGICWTPDIQNLELTCYKCKVKSKRKYFGRDEFEKVIERINSSSRPLLLGLSGGRDSSYVLSELIETWNVRNILTYTYDWGVNTPYARNNVSKICGHYGIRNILVAADIRKKRKDVQSVVKAYCRSPVPSLVPLLMAGDKQFISTAQKISNQLNSSAEIFGFNPFEKTRFKEELVWKNLWPQQDDGLYGEDLSVLSQLKLIIGYSQKIVFNPSYWGRNLIDAAKGFINYYHSGVERTNYFDYFEWNEKVVDDKLSQIGWLRPANGTTWRIGDGTSAFYNIAYILHQGWCENDILRSNQVRYGHYKLSQIQELLMIDNAVNVEMLEWYFSILELNPDKYLNMLISKYEYK